MDLEIQTKKIELIQWLTTLEDHVVIQDILDLRNKVIEKQETNISEAEKASVSKGIMQANQKILQPNAEAEKIYGKWL